MKKSILNIATISLLVGAVIGALLCCICLYTTGYLGLNNTESDSYELSYYAGNCFDVDDDFIKFINNNPIDKKYSEQLNDANTPTEQAEIIGHWLDIYDEEIDAVWEKFEQVINSQTECVDSDVTAKALDDLARLKRSYEEYRIQDLHFSESYKLATSGIGSGMSSYCCFLSLNKERIVFFDLVEQLVSCTGHFKFKTENLEYIADC